MVPLPPPIDPEPFPADASNGLFKYSQAMQLAMMDFQMIEEGLRMCLVRAYALIFFRLRGTLPFHLPIKDLEKDALGRLISKFEQFSDDLELVEKLKQMQPFRNRCAHRGMLLTVEQQRDVEFLRTETKAIYAMQLTARECLSKLLREWQRLEDVLNQNYSPIGLGIEAN